MHLRTAALFSCVPPSLNKKREVKPIPRTFLPSSSTKRSPCKMSCRSAWVNFNSFSILFSLYLSMLWRHHGAEIRLIVGDRIQQPRQLLQAPARSHLPPRPHQPLLLWPHSAVYGLPDLQVDAQEQSAALALFASQGNRIPEGLDVQVEHWNPRSAYIHHLVLGQVVAEGI